MRRCFDCKGKMLIVELVDIKDKTHRALVCPRCGRFYTNHRKLIGKERLDA